MYVDCPYAGPCWSITCYFLSYFGSSRRTYCGNYFPTEYRSSMNVPWHSWFQSFNCKLSADLWCSRGGDSGRICPRRGNFFFHSLDTHSKLYHWALLNKTRGSVLGFWPNYYPTLFRLIYGEFLDSSSLKPSKTDYTGIYSSSVIALSTYYSCLPFITDLLLWSLHVLLVAIHTLISLISYTQCALR